MAYKTSVFPEGGYDTFVQLYDLPLSYEPLVEEFIVLRSKDRTPQEETRYDELTGILQNYIIDTEKWNKFCDAVTGVQKFFLENTQGYIDGLKTETRDYVDGKKLEIENTATTAQNTINSTKDAALISIENKKDNVIDYLDGTTAGALRNDIGDMSLSEIEGRSLIDKTNLLKEDIEGLAGEGRTIETVKETSDRVGLLTGLLTRVKTSIVNALNGLQEDVDEHKAEYASETESGHIKLSDIPSKVARITIGTKTSGWTANDCDYLCDGVSDQVEINNAIQALPSSGGEIVLLDGNYNISSSILINKNNVTLRGNGKSTVLNRKWSSTTSTNSGVIMVKNGLNPIKGVLIRDISINGNSGTYTGIYQRLIEFHTASECICMNCWFYDSSSTGVYVYSSSNNSFINNIFYNVGTAVNNSDALQVGSNDVVLANKFNNCNTPIFQDYSSSKSIITNNTIAKDSWGTTQYSMRISGSNNLISLNLLGGKDIQDSGSGNTLVNNKV